MRAGCEGTSWVVQATADIEWLPPSSSVAQLGYASFVPVARKLLGLPGGYSHAKFGELSAMVYRDTINQKHAGRERLEKELGQKGGKLEDTKRRPAVRNTHSIAAIVLDHLLAAA